MVQRLKELASSLDGRVVVLAGLGLLLVTVAIGATQQGAAAMWDLLGVPAIETSFSDARVLTAGWECTRQGVDVLAVNPCDFLSRRMNYPRVWTFLAPLGLDDGATVAIGVALIAILVVTAVFVLGRLSFREGLLALLFMVSPPVLLVMERANVDILMVALGAFAFVPVGSRSGPSPIRTSLLVGLAALLKLFPIAGAMALLVAHDRKRAVRAFLLVTGLFTVYALSTLGDLRLISEGTPRPEVYAFGISVLLIGMRFALHDAPLIGTLFQPGNEVVLHVAAVVVCAVIAIVGAKWLATRMPPPVSMPYDPRQTLFVYGASLYIGAYIIGSNWPYRFVVLLLVLPRFFAAIRMGGFERRWGIVGCTLTLVCAWLTILASVVTEAANVTLFLFLWSGVLHAIQPVLSDTLRGVRMALKATAT